jgi:hypothetical protein
MNSSESSQQTSKPKPFLGFVALVGALFLIFYAVRKVGGTIPALIVTYLCYAHRDELADGIKEVLQHVKP